MAGETRKPAKGDYSHPNLLFAYGSLTRDMNNVEGAQFTANPPVSFTEKANWWGETRLRGRLYIVENARTSLIYPGIELDYYGSAITADVYNIPSPQIFNELDAWEDASVDASGTPSQPTQRPYLRRVVTTMWEGQLLTGWVYEGRHHWSERRYIPHTSWAQYATDQQKSPL